MSELIVRRLMIDLGSGFARHWHGGDAFRTALFNALSMSFPVGEQFFIDSVRHGVAALPEAEQAAFQNDLAGFVGQEATHRHIHGMFNKQLALQGYTNTWATRAARRSLKIVALDPRHQVGVTAAYEHYTAVLADWLLSHQESMAGVEPRLKTMWLWHSVEESEHKSVAFDLYKALGGSNAWRRRWFRRASFFFATDLMRQTLRNLAHDGALLQWSTYRSAYAYLFGKNGLVRGTWAPLKAYLADDFHPAQFDSTRLTSDWLVANATTFQAVRAA